MKENKKVSKDCLEGKRSNEGAPYIVKVVIPSGRGQSWKYDQLRQATSTIAETSKELAEILSDLRSTSSRVESRAEDIKSKLKFITDALDLARGTITKESEF